VSVRPGQAQQITVSDDLAAMDDDGPAHTFTFDYVYDQVSARGGASRVWLERFS
jgi:hypothetical protein